MWKYENGTHLVTPPGADTAPRAPSSQPRGRVGRVRGVGEDAEHRAAGAGAEPLRLLSPLKWKWLIRKRKEKGFSFDVFLMKGTALCAVGSPGAASPAGTVPR